MSHQKPSLIDVVSRYNRWIAIIGFVLLGIIYLLLQQYPPDATLPDILEAGAVDILPDILATILIYIFVTFLYADLLDEMQRLDRENDADIAGRIDALHERIEERTDALDYRFSRLERSLSDTIPHLETEDDDAPLSEPVSNLLNQLIHPATLDHVSEREIREQLMNLTRRGILNQKDYSRLLQQLSTIEDQTLHTPPSSGQSEGQ